MNPLLNIENPSINIDQNRMVVDPLFLNPENCNVRLNPTVQKLKNGSVRLNQYEMSLSIEFPEKFK